MNTPLRSHPRNQRVPALPRRRPLALCVSALILSGALAGPAGAQAFPPVINLGSLTGADGFRLDGVAAFDKSGTSVSTAGDINGDGLDDLLIGAYGADPNGASYAGSSYVVFGKSTPFSATLLLSGLNGLNGFRLDGATAGDRSGFSVSAAGDINGDGLEDLLIGAYVADPNGNASGSSYVVFGKTTPFAATLALSALNGSDGFRLDGVATGDLSGQSVSFGGNVGGDGAGDLIISAPHASPNGNGQAGAVYMVFGNSTAFAPTFALSALNGSNGFRLDGEAGVNTGQVSAAGDINGDGQGDLVIGAPNSSPNGNGLAGSSYVVFGSTSIGATLALTSLDGTSGFRLDGAAPTDESGRSVSAAGDINGDGLGDLIVGALGADPNANSDAGSSYVLFGKSTPFAATLALSSLNGTNGFRLDGVAAGDFSGSSVSAAGDINGDGVDDLIVGAIGADPAGIGSGSSFVVFGKTTPFAVTLALSALNGSDGFRLDGAAVNDYTGRSVSAAGDINGDGHGDLVVGAPGADPNGNGRAGSSYVLFGHSEAPLFANGFEG